MSNDASNGAAGEAGTAGSGTTVDVTVVGAGMAGLYLLHRLREAGLRAVALEAADDVGGTWYWNRYPGARCDVESIDYSYSWDPELDDQWTWSEKYATQPEILRYLGFVADKHDLRRDIRFSTRVESARWDADAERWRVRTDAGDEIVSRFHVMATGCLSVPKEPDIAGWERFEGPTYFTGRWPHEGVDFTGRRVAVIGTGSSAIQSIPIIAGQARELTVLQRTANFSVPAHNGPVDPAKQARYDADRAGYREAARRSRIGVPVEQATVGAMQVSDEERLAAFEAGWDEGLFGLTGRFNDIITNPASNAAAAEFVRERIRSIVDDPETAEALCPTGYPLASKRLCVDTGYYETYNLPHVRLVDLRRTPIETITETGIALGGPDGGEHLEVDDLVLAIGFDAMTGPLVSVDIRGRDGITLRDKWADGPATYLGLTSVGFPNLFMVTGPGSPSVLSNMVVSIEQHVDWITDCLVHMRDHDHTTIEPTPTAEAGWVQHVNDCADITLFPQANSWYVGANVPGKPRVFLPYVGGVGIYRATCERVADEGFLGFAFEGPGGRSCNDGVVNRLQPDVAILLEVMAELGLPELDTLAPTEARALMEAMAAERPPGPEVGEVVDGTLPGPVGELAYRAFRPPTDGPHQVVVHFHGGGWVLGSHDSEEPFCRDLCVRSDAIVVSVDYRHAPEARFPSAVDDALAAVRWVGEHAVELGGNGRPLVVAGWSAGGNLATVTARRIRDEGGPTLAGQLLVTPVTDGDTAQGSFVENAEGYVLTASLMRWFWDRYCDPDDRAHPDASPLRAPDLSGLPPAVVFTSEFDPLRDQGAAYVDALTAAGVPAELVPCRGQIHTSLTAVDVILSSAPIRARMADAVRALSGAASAQVTGRSEPVARR